MPDNQPKPGMKWSLPIGSVAGIGIYIHATFWILIAWVVIGEWSRNHDAARAIGAAIFILALFGCVVLHELGHALTALRYNVRTRDITLLPIGGLARLEKMPDRPIEEFWVAVAGPAVNVVIAALIFAGLTVTGQMQPLTDVSVIEGLFWMRLMLVNITLVLFNLLPAFPMDGGRVLRALLAMKLDYARATQIAASIGQGMALLFGLAGLFANPVLLFIALFVWIGAEQEASMATMKSAFSGIPVERAMETVFRELSPYDSLDVAVEAILAGTQHDFPVVDGEVVGILTRSGLMKALAQKQTASVGEVMTKDFEIAHPGEMLEAAVLRLQQSPARTMPVVQGGALVGMLTSENVSEFLMIQSALGKSRGPVAVPR